MEEFFVILLGGDFLDKKEVTYPAFSFAIDDRQNYWFYVGNNTTYGDAKMICTDENIANVAYYLHQKSNMLPMVENNFGRNGEWLTFHESLNHDLYTIENGKLDLSYAMDFPN
ncbi:6-bladed beta-propeller [Phocaeicola vulgatus]|uniref:6-bladed beta-propeller n=1 Tax=Phocaeicola vulgatus TaxID=821 RepID=UPI002166A78F|nr:6-bladed beta-propeller [Phocaeicola vulgatus]MCS2551431.1 6-bladed beta-propeller [Phocaeicola vulgatus]